MGSFTPLVFSATGGMAPAATIMYKRLASLLAEKRHQTYSKTISWLRCSIGFSLVRSAVMCLYVEVRDDLQLLGARGFVE